MRPAFHHAMAPDRRLLPPPRGGDAAQRLAHAARIGARTAKCRQAVLQHRDHGIGEQPNPAFLARAAVAATAPARAALDLAAKRAIDVAAAAAGLIALWPVLLVAMAAIRLTTKGPALLRQIRVGQDGREFGVWKLRSMYIDADAHRAALLRDNQHGTGGVTFKMRNDPRVTPLGNWLRRSSVDELPQLWNVLVGDMSLVGPRPPLPQEVARYTPAQLRRLAAKPGLTCLWQISGRSNLAFDRQVELDILYIATRSVVMDIAILLRTIPAVLTARGAY
jgi:lipopolysaccharide/colanic/teichoic acid biosynthesis glycosyltransferase